MQWSAVKLVGIKKDCYYSGLKNDSGLFKKVRLKAPVKVGMDREVKVLYMVKASDQLWPRVMRWPLVRVAAKR